jgi:hypothetical protein
VAAAASWAGDGMEGGSRHGMEDTGGGQWWASHTAFGGSGASARAGIGTAWRVDGGGSEGSTGVEGGASAEGSGGGGKANYIQNGSK